VGISSTQSRYRYYVLAVLFTANLLNYLDRQVIYAVFPLIKSDLQISDTALGSLGSVFMLCYMVSAPLFGWLGDRLKRVRIASFGLLAWSFATAAAGFPMAMGCCLLPARWSA